MKPHAKTALSLALAIVGGMAAGMRCDASPVAVSRPDSAAVFTSANPALVCNRLSDTGDPCFKNEGALRGKC